MLLVLIFMITVPIFTVSTYKDAGLNYSFGLRAIAEFYPNYK